MIVFRLKAAFSFISALLIYLFEWKKVSPLLFFCGENLLKVTYRIPESEQKDWLITFKIFKRIIFESMPKKLPYIEFKEQTGIAIFDGDLDTMEVRKNYVEKFADEKVSLHISRNDLLSNASLLVQITTILFLCFVSLPVFIISLFSKNRLTAPFLFREYIEICRLNDIIIKKKIVKLHHFCIFEVDSNICSYLLMKEGIRINKIPSEVPLHFFNTTIVSDSLSYCFAYQEEEFKARKESMFVKKTHYWAPELFLQAPKRFLSAERSNKKPEFELGFYSSANWLRTILGNVDLGHNDKENEELLLKEMIAFAVQNRVSLRIYPHPIEKREKNRSLTENYYKSLITSSFVTVSAWDKPSIESFDEINLGVSLYSTLMFERIYFGFKTILAPWGYPEFPLPYSSLRNICALSPKELPEKIAFNLPLSQEEFFNTNKLNHYSFLDFKKTALR